MRRLPLAAALLIMLLPAAAWADAPPAGRDDAGVAPAPAPPPPAGGAQDANRAKKMRPSGAQVLPVAPPDASTARGQERGNAALRTGQSPTQGGAGADDDSRREK